MCCTICKSFTGKLYLFKKIWNFEFQKMVKCYMHINPVSHGGLQFNLFIYICIHVSTLWIPIVAFATLFSIYLIKPLPQCPYRSFNPPPATHPPPPPTPPPPAHPPPITCHSWYYNRCENNCSKASSVR